MAGFEQAPGRAPRGRAPPGGTPPGGRCRSPGASAPGARRRTTIRRPGPRPGARTRRPSDQRLPPRGQPVPGPAGSDPARTAAPGSGRLVGDAQPVLRFPYGEVFGGPVLGLRLERPGGRLQVRRDRRCARIRLEARQQIGQVLLVLRGCGAQCSDYRSVSFRRRRGRRHSNVGRLRVLELPRRLRFRWDVSQDSGQTEPPLFVKERNSAGRDSPAPASPREQNAIAILAC